MSLYRNALETWVGNIKVKADRVLDVGGGQLPISKRVKSWDVKEYLIADNDAQYKPDIFMDLNHKSDVGKFDVVFCLEVMEYIWNPVVAHKNLGDMVEDGGVAYISYPTIYPLHNPIGIDYLRYSKNVIEKYLGMNFKTWEITPRIATDGLGPLRDFYSYEGMRAMKNTSDVFDIGYMAKVIK